MRLIDADKVINAMQKCLDEAPDKKDSVAYFAFESIIECLKQEPTVDAIPLTAAELKYLMNDTIAYIWRLEKRGCDKPEFGYDSRKALLEKLKQFYEEHFPERTCSG